MIKIIEDEDMDECRELAQSGHPVGICYYIGGLVERERYQQALAVVERLIEDGHWYAASSIAAHLYSQMGAKPDVGKWVEWLEKAASHGAAWVKGDACFDLGLHYLTLQVPEALSYLRTASDCGYAEAAVVIGDCYETGTGVEKDYLEAARWYMRAADTDNVDDGDRYLPGDKWPATKEHGWVDLDLLEAFASELDDNQREELFRIAKRPAGGAA